MNNEELIAKLTKIFELFTEFNEVSFKKSYDDLNINEVHTIDFIGKIEKVNVTKITNCLKITKGGVTKITKKLIEKGYISSYQSENNKKEKYFKLTSKGKIIFSKHIELHEQAIKKDALILSQFDNNEKIIINEFLDALSIDFENKLKEN